MHRIERVEIKLLYFQEIYIIDIEDILRISPFHLQQFNRNRILVVDVVHQMQLYCDERRK